MSNWPTVATLTFLSVFALGQLTERRRPVLRRWMLRTLERIPASVPAPAREGGGATGT